MALTTVLLDMDGVVRHFTPDHAATIEAAHGLHAGTLTSTAFEHGLLESLVTGRIRRSEWVEAIAESIGNRLAVRHWLADRGSVDESLLREVDELRRSGTTVAILTNGTDETANEVIELGLAERFDAIFSTADIGFAKPDPRAFAHVATALDVDPTRVFFTDDTESKLAGAVELGMTARRYVGVQTFRTHLAQFGFALR